MSRFGRTRKVQKPPSVESHQHSTGLAIGLRGSSREERSAFEGGTIFLLRAWSTRLKESQTGLTASRGRALPGPCGGGSQLITVDGEESAGPYQRRPLEHKSDSLRLL
ncbi:unnamed protein product [Pleuronectes platessa]|uniref:Uncharacterized protein n=1 Tax=Pleuronectes platessa TaxID=8262 RepID=A0A9N7YCY6_PLEPL|nr:unnamed protein product [Pleuronectes platessa]